MRTILAIILTFLFSIAFSSCSKEDEFEKLQNKEFKIMFKVSADDPRKIVYLPGFGGVMTEFKGSWQYEFVTKKFFAGIVAECLDEEVCITIEAYVNGKLHVKKTGTRLVNCTFRLKGKGY